MIALRTNGRDWVPTLLRVVLGLTMLPHGAQKLFGWFGGYGWEGTMGFFTGSLGIPAPVAALVIGIETLGALLLVLGAGARLQALGFVAVMLGAVATLHLDHGFFMNWSGQQAGEGFEYHLLVIAMAAVVVVRGAGAWSVDAFISERVGEAAPGERWSGWSDATA